MGNGQFLITDYILFTLMLLISALIGIYFGFFGKKKKSEGEYLLGSKEMAVFPVAMSLISSFVSGTTILAAPSDIYSYGPYFGLSTICPIVNTLFTAYVSVPVFYNLQITSGYEYLKLRFGEKVRKIAAILFVSTTLLKLPLIIYTPALALSQCTGIDVHILTPIVSGVCIFYTTLGGFKAVVWTDNLQFMLTVVSCIVIMIFGTVAQGGILQIFSIAKDGGRLDISFDPDPTLKDSFFNIIIGVSLTQMGMGISQSYLQKCLSLPSYKKVKVMMWIFCVGKMLFTAGMAYIGLMIYARYYDCDPQISGKIKKIDQIMPLYILEIAEKLPGLAGLFVAGVFSASLSTLSSYLNATPCIVYRDLVLPHLSKELPEDKINYLLKFISLTVGILSTGMVYFIEKLGSLLPMMISFYGAVSGPILGLFCLGMLFPFTNSKGALSGAIASLTSIAFITTKSYYYKFNNIIVYPSLPVSVDGCEDFNTTVTWSSNPTTFHEQPLMIYRITFYYYTLIGTSIVLIVGIIVSLITKKENEEVDRKLLSPVIHWALPTPRGKYHSVEKALDLTNVKNGIEIIK